jgi:hypothetical protein
MTEININGGSQSPGILCDIVAEDDASHGALARARLAHQQNFLLLLLARLGRWRGGRLILDVEVAHLVHGGGVEGFVGCLLAGAGDAQGRSLLASRPWQDFCRR